ncbi:MAG: hypothetical protein H7A32_04905 [Deltaproteobacteria bacterium]|nr:hypothetical protein [Deltaproteobacteria bacterium]
MKKKSEVIIDNFLDLMKKLVMKKISGPHFEKKYLEMSRAFRDNEDYLEVPEEIRLLISHVFVSVDAYCSDPTIRDENDIDENQLREEVKTELLKIKPELKTELP